MGGEENFSGSNEWQGDLCSSRGVINIENVDFLPTKKLRSFETAIKEDFISQSSKTTAINQCARYNVIVTSTRFHSFFSPLLNSDQNITTHNPRDTVITIKYISH